MCGFDRFSIKLSGIDFGANKCNRYETPRIDVKMCIYV